MEKTVFCEYKNDKETVYKGHLWVREMFLLAQYHSPTEMVPLFFPLALLLTCSYVVLERIWDEYVDPPE